MVCRWRSMPYPAGGKRWLPVTGVDMSAAEMVRYLVDEYRGSRATKSAMAYRYFHRSCPPHRIRPATLCNSPASGRRPRASPATSTAFKTSLDTNYVDFLHDAAAAIGPGPRRRLDAWPRRAKRSSGGVRRDASGRSHEHQPRHRVVARPAGESGRTGSRVAAKICLERVLAALDVADAESDLCCDSPCPIPGGLGQVRRPGCRRTSRR